MKTVFKTFLSRGSFCSRLPELKSLLGRIDKGCILKEKLDKTLNQTTGESVKRELNLTGRVVVQATKTRKINGGREYCEWKDDELGFEHQ